MNYLKILTELNTRYGLTDSIKEKSKLDKKISELCFAIIDKIHDLEEKYNIKELLRVTRDHWNPTNEPQYGTYSCNTSSDDEVIIYHKYMFRGDEEMDAIVLPSYVLTDMESGVKRFYEEKMEIHQENLRKSIIQDLKHIKNKFGKLESIPADFQKIIDDEFWNLI